jgi:hypothetical protein
MYFEVTGDKFRFYREYWNAVPVVDAFGGELFKKTFNTDEK